jgi:hypothetical protein
VHDEKRGKNITVALVIKEEEKRWRKGMNE